MSDSEIQLMKFHSDTFEAVRKEFDLDKPGRMDEAVNILREWLKKENHLVKKDFPRMYLETTLITSKGLVERSKQRIDKLCTLRTLMPEYFVDDITKEMFSPLKKVLTQAHLPTLTKTHHRVSIVKILSDDFDYHDFQIFYKYLVVASEYSKLNDYNSGYFVVLDCRDINILNFVTKMSPLELRRVFTLINEGYGMRIKRIDIISASSIIDLLVSLIRQVVTAKLSERIQVHKDLDTLHEKVERHIFPEDYGGEEKPLQTLFEQWLDVISSKKHVQFCREMNQAKTDETCRSADVFNEQYLGIPGCFRALSVD